MQSRGLGSRELHTESSGDLQGAQVFTGALIRTCLWENNSRPEKEPAKGAEGRLLRAHTGRGIVSAPTGESGNSSFMGRQAEYSEGPASVKWEEIGP